MKTRILITIIALSLFTTTFAIAQKTAGKANTEAKQDSSIKREYVSMYYNEIIDTPCEPVIVDGKIYNGCCKFTSGQLRTNKKTRYSTDPFSGEKVDKATAYIAPDPNKEKGVLYFESKENYNRYFKQLNYGQYRKIK
ncbi:MAG: hypothetical protein GXO81_03870 [Chlorobi bacterium]|nr:hypothetical protein [Chlorobiota bacterium]